MFKSRSLGLFGLGFVVGATIVGGLIWWRSAVTFRDQYYSKLMEVTSNAAMIRSGHADMIVKNVEASIQQCIPAATSIWGDHEARLPSFWYAQRYYKRFDLIVPGELKPIFAALPPDPRRNRPIDGIVDIESEPNQAEHRSAVDAAPHRN